MREHLEAAANSPRASAARERARAKLDGPPAPESLVYLRDILYRVHGRSGVGMGGLAPLSPSTIRDWCELSGVVLEPGEVDALMELDGVLLSEAAKARPAHKADAPNAKRR